MAGPSVSSVVSKARMAGESWGNLNSSLRDRVQALINASGGKLQLVSGWRSNKRQKELWDQKYAQNLKKYGNAAAAYKATRHVVAVPGSSKHEDGEAVDLGPAGNLSKQEAYALIKRLAPQFGLHTPMPWEPWHVQRVDLENSDHGGDSMTEPPDDHQPADNFSTNINTLASMFGIEVESSYEPGTEAATGGTSSAPNGEMDLDTFMQRLAGVENRSGNPNVANKRTGAHGLYQIMPNNWAPWAKEAGLGPNAAKTPENQTRVARFKMQQYYNQFKNWGAVAAAWYGGPGAAQRYLKNPNDPYLHRKHGGGDEPSIIEYIQRVL